MTKCMMAYIETIPEWLRDSHTAAGNRGSYPVNGAAREWCDCDGQDLDPDWARVVYACGDAHLCPRCRVAQCREAVRREWGDCHQYDDDTLLCVVDDHGGIDADDPEAEAALGVIREIAARHGCSAEWTGNSNGDTSDVSITPH